MTTPVAHVGPWRAVLERVGFRTLPTGGRAYAYVLQCGHEVERRQTGRVDCYCELCGTQEAATP